MEPIEQLFEAVREERRRRIRDLLLFDPTLVNVMGDDEQGRLGALHLAARLGKADTTQQLIEYGADIDLRDPENDATPLCWAAFFGRPAVAQCLLRAGADPSARNVHGLTPLACAAEGARGKWLEHSNATVQEWRATGELIRQYGGVE